MIGRYLLIGANAVLLSWLLIFAESVAVDARFEEKYFRVFYAVAAVACASLLIGLHWRLRVQRFMVAPLAICHAVLAVLAFLCLMPGPGIGGTYWYWPVAPPVLTALVSFFVLLELFYERPS